MMRLLLSLCVLLFITNGLDEDFSDDSLWEEANICCKAQTTKFGCINSGSRCVWLSKKNKKERKIANRFNSRCLVRRFVECKKIDITADCNNGDGTAEPVCNPTYDTFESTSDIEVAKDKQIGVITIFDENLEIDITFTTPSDDLPYAHNKLLVVGDDYDAQNYPSIGLIWRGTYDTGDICVGLSGITRCLGNDFIWNLNKQYHIELSFKKDSYFRIVINRGEADEYRENSKTHGDSTPSLAITGPVTMPIYASLARNVAGSNPNVANGVVINDLQMRSYRFDYDYDEEEDEEEYEAIFGHIGIWQDESNNTTDIELFGALLIATVLCLYFVYSKCNGSKYEKYTLINDSNQQNTV